MSHHFSRPDFTGCGFRAHTAATTAIFFFSTVGGRVYYWRPLTCFFACIGVEFRIQWLLVGNGLEAFAVFGGRLGSLVRARSVPLVITLGSALSSSSLSFLARISSHLISSRRTNSISLLSFHPDLFFSQAISRSAKQGAWSGNIADLHWKGGHSKPHTSVPPPHHHIFHFSPFDNREPSRFHGLLPPHAALGDSGTKSSISLSLHFGSVDRPS